MIKIIRNWFNRYFSDPEAVLLLVILIIGFSLVIFMGGIFAPVLISIVFAYLLQGIVNFLQRLKIPRMMAVVMVFIGFIGILLVFFLILFPLIWKQLAALFEELPGMVTKGEQTLRDISLRFPQFFPEGEWQSMISSSVSDVKSWGKVVLAASLSSITSLITWIVYLVLVPLLVFFFLKDKNRLLQGLGQFLPKKRGVLRKVSAEVKVQIGNYLRGKVVEILVVGFATYLVFWYFGLYYGVLLATLVGLSVLIPYVGAVVVTIPVALVGYLEWGIGPQYGYCMLAYLIVQGLDANILVPLLFSEAVNIHPVAIIVATLFFGGIWGFWGVFFAIPLATLIKAVLNAWPKHQVLET